MLKRFLLSFFIFGTVFTSSYAMEHKPSPPPLGLSPSSIKPKPPSPNQTPSPIDLTKVPSDDISYVMSDISYQPDGYTYDKLPIILKPLESIDRKTLTHAIAQELYEFLAPLEIQFNYKNALQDIIKFFTKSIVNAHVTLEMAGIKRPYSLKDIICALIYFEKALNAVANDDTYQEYLGDPIKSIINLSRIFIASCITAINMDSEPFITVPKSLPFDDPHLLLEVEEYRDYLALRYRATPITPKKFIAGVLNQLEKEFPDLIGRTTKIDIEKELLPLVDRILPMATKSELEKAIQKFEAIQLTDAEDQTDDNKETETIQTDYCALTEDLPQASEGPVVDGCPKTSATDAENNTESHASKTSTSTTDDRTDNQIDNEKKLQQITNLILNH